MNLPFVLNIAIGLIFVYLTLSLLASELQELLTTVMQWRAKHLKEGIEVLLAGGSATPEQEHVRELVSKIYNDPLLKNINQEAKGIISSSVRRLSRWLLRENRRPTFDSKQSTGPSYIAPETFATSLLERLGIPTLTAKLTEVRLEKFVARMVGEYSIAADGTIRYPEADALKEGWQKGRIRLIAEKVNLLNLSSDQEFTMLVDDCNDILVDFKTGKSTLETAIERLGEALNSYIIASEDDKDPTYVKRLQLYKLGLFGPQNERAIVAGGLRPSIAEIAELLNQSSSTYREVASAYEAMRGPAQNIQSKVDAEIKLRLEKHNEGLETPMTLKQLSYEQHQLFVNDALSQLIQQGGLTNHDREIYNHYQTYQEIQSVLNKLPRSLSNSLESLSRRAETRTQKLGSDMSHYRDEIALWFDRSMNRSSGVYKRNAKGVAITIGIVLASFSNSDSFYVADRLTSDTNLRDVITKQATNVVTQTNASRPNATSQLTTEELRNLKDTTDLALKDLSVPVGWSAANLSQQFNCSTPVNPANPIGSNDSEWSKFFKKCLPNQSLSGDIFIPEKIAEIGLQRPIDLIRILLGWIVTGIAIAMGAPFWFDLLSKIINVRNTGTKPASLSKPDHSK